MLRFLVDFVKSFYMFTITAKGWQIIRNTTTGIFKDILLFDKWEKRILEWIPLLRMKGQWNLDRFKMTKEIDELFIEKEKTLVEDNQEVGEIQQLSIKAQDDKSLA